MTALALMFLLPCTAFAQQPPEIQPLPPEWKQTIDDAPMTAQQFAQQTPADWLARAVQAVSQQVRAPMVFACRVCAVLILCAGAKSLCGESAAGLARMLDLLAGLAVLTLCAAQMAQLASLLEQGLNTARVYLASFIPVFASVLTACGQAGSAMVYTGIFFAGANLIANMLCWIGIPMLQICIACAAVGCVCSFVDFYRISRLLCKLVQWLLMLGAAIFTSMMTLQGVFAQSADSLALKAGKLVLGSAVPVVGRAVSDAMGGVLAAMRVMKGSVGFAAVAVLAAVFLPLILQCLLYRISFASAELAASALSSPRAGAFLGCMAECTGVYVSMACLFSFVAAASTILMILLGSGGG